MRGTTLRLLNLREGEARLAAALITVLAINAAVLELSDVVATAGFVSNLGAAKMPWLWIADMLVALVVATFFATRIDRMPRLRLLSWMIGGLAVLYLLLLGLFRAGLPDWITYPGLYIMADQQFMLFPLVFWALVNDVYTMAQAKRLIPVIGAGMAIGSVAGNLLPALHAAIVSQRGGDNTYLFVAAIALLLLSLAILRLTFRKREVRARQSTPAEGDLRHTIRVGMDYFTNLPVLYYLGIAMLLIGLALTMIEFNFLFMIDATFATGLAFQVFYGVYKAALIVALVLFQGLVTGRLLAKMPLRNGYPVLPITLLAASGVAAVTANLAGGAAGRFAARFVERAWDEPVRKATLALVPDERRGRVSTFLDSYFFTLATIVGSVILLVLFWAGARYPASYVVYAYLMVAALASAGAIWAARRARAAYEASLLNWRLARSRRKSALDGIEF
jgi:ATP:ADP antiporter, AAA family